MLTVDPARLGLGPGRRVLDLGCGGGRHAYEAWKTGATVVALDANADELTPVVAMVGAMCEVGEIDASPGGAVAADAMTLPFACDTFDAVIASEVFEHLVEDEVAMAEVRRVLRAGGLLAVSVPRTMPEALNWLLSKGYRTSPGGHVRIYRRRQLLARLDKAGFELQAISHRHGLHSPYWWLRCALGVDRPERKLVAAYHRLLVWEIERQPRSLRLLARILDPLIGKSLVCYLVAAGATR